MSEDCSPFDMLPNEVVLKIVKMFFNSEKGMDLYNGCICKEFNPFAPAVRNKEYLMRAMMHGECFKRTMHVMVLANVSQRFRCLSEDISKSNWSGEVKICGIESELMEIIQNMPNEVSISRLDVTGIYGVLTILHANNYVPDTYVSSESIRHLAAKIPNIHSLHMSSLKFDCFPPQTKPLLFLQKFEISKVTGRIFENVDFSAIMPNIVHIDLGGGGIDHSIDLPDMTQCEHLRYVNLNCGKYVFPDKIPFPRGLKALKGRDSQLIKLTLPGVDNALWVFHHDFQKYFTNYFFEMNIKIYNMTPDELERATKAGIQKSRYLEVNPTNPGNLMSLSEKKVYITEIESELKDIIHHRKWGEDIVETLYIVGLVDENDDPPTLTSIDFMQLAMKCPKIVELNMLDVSVKSFPPLISPWQFLRKITISRISRLCFKNVEFHDILPSLRMLHVKGEGLNSTTILPNMSGCEMLNEITLDEGDFIFPDKIPFPYGLRKLKGTSSNLCYTEASMEGTMMESITDLEEVNDLFQLYFQDCVVGLKIASLKTCLPKL